MPAEEDDAGSLQPPQHPVPHLQGPFEESMMESNIEADDAEQGPDPATRRKLLLQGDKYERVCAGRWKQKSGEKFHPLWKLAAQLTFGIHLLARGMAMSEEEVMRILQSHVDDVDGFLERTSQDFDLAQTDVDDRLGYLRLPLQHVHVFDHMLEDRAFRASIVEGNEKIEHIVERTSEAMKDALKDVQKGIDATAALGKYLTQLRTSWMDRSFDQDAVYTAMLGNVEGWTRAFVDLHLQGSRLAVGLFELAEIIAEMQRRAGIVSRKGLPASRPSTNGGYSPAQKSIVSEKRRYRSQPSTSNGSPKLSTTNELPNKPLPQAPDTMATTRQPSRAKLIHHDTQRSRSLEREQRRPKDRQDHPERKSSMADKVRSVAKLGTQHSPAAKSKSTKTLNSKSSTAGSPKLTKRSSSTRTSILTKSKNHSPKKTPDLQAGGPVDFPVELPAEVPGGAVRKEEGPKKSGLHLRLGSKSRDRDHGSGPVPSKSFSLFRRSPQPGPSGGARMTSQSAGTLARAEDSSESSPALQQTQDADDQSSSQSATPFQRPSPDPGLPTPPALVSANAAHGEETHSYTALPDVLATAQRVKSARASLRLSVPLSTEMEAERTPRAVPSKSSESSEPDLRLALPLPIDCTVPARSEIFVEQQPSGPTSREPGLEVSPLHPVKTLHSNLTTATDGEKTAVASRQPQHLPFSPSTASRDRSADADDPVLTSATMRCWSDFCKMPPQAASPAATPTATPDHSELPPPLARAGPTSSPVGAYPTDDHKNRPILARGEQSEQVRDSQLSHSRSRGSNKPASLQKTWSNVTGPSLKPQLIKGSSNASAIFDLIAATPPTSPIHTRSASDVESSTSTILGPPDQAPPPPAPGGRSMIDPDFASAGALEGERKPKRNGPINANGWKRKMFSPNGSACASGAASPVKSVSGIAPVPSDNESEEIQMSANLMSGKGNDVLWYRGMGKDGLWVS